MSDAPSAYKLNRQVLELSGILNMWVTQLGHYEALHKVQIITFMLQLFRYSRVFYYIYVQLSCL